VLSKVIEKCGNKLFVCLPVSSTVVAIVNPHNLRLYGPGQKITTAPTSSKKDFKNIFLKFKPVFNEFLSCRKLF
jgi:hypothetical protein